MRLILNTDKGFLHANVFFQNINEAEIMVFGNDDEAHRYGMHLVKTGEIKNYKIEYLGELKSAEDYAEFDSLDIKTGTFLCSKVFIDLLEIKNHIGIYKEETDFSSELYQFPSIADLYEKLEDDSLIRRMKDSGFSRELFHIPKDFYNDHASTYDNEDDGILINVKNEIFYLTGGFNA